MVLRLAIGLLSLSGAIAPKVACAWQQESLPSPNGRLEVVIRESAGQLSYQIKRDGDEVVGFSPLGLKTKNPVNDMTSDFKLVAIRRDAADETWEQPWGEERFIRDWHNELSFHISNLPGAKINLIIKFRAFNDGVGFRYEVPHAVTGAFTIVDELTEFNLVDAGKVWSIPAFVDNRYEHLFQESNLSEIENGQTPLTITMKNYVLSIHEANLTDYASMTLRQRGGGRLGAELVPWKDGSKVKAVAPMVSPWRTIQIADRLGDLLNSHLILNLNEPNKLTDTSWIKPQKYIGIWWGMHIDRYSWATGSKQGATTERAKQYMDFAAEQGFAGVLVEGWNQGWDGNWLENGDVFSFTESATDFDLEEVARYGQQRGVNLIGHHETSAGISNYESQVEEAFQLYQKLGVRVVKTGYVGDMVEGEEWHHGQFMVRHFRKITLLAAKYGLMLDVHEPIKDTGLRRSYPHLMTREGARGQEYNAWGHAGGNPPSYATILPFTRSLSGPFDFTPGIFVMDGGRKAPPARAQTTLAKQLAYYVTIYSPLQMAADLPEHYRGHPALQFIKDVPVDWEFTRALDDQIGELVTILRKDRHSGDFYLGSVSNEEPHKLHLTLEFLAAQKTYEAQIYQDAANAHYFYNPQAVVISKQDVSSTSVLDIALAPGGGLAIRFKEK